MNNNITPDTLIRYLDHELEPDEGLYVEAQLLADPALRAQLERLQLAKQAITQYGRKQQVSNIHRQMMKEMHQPPVAKVTWMRTGLRIAAILIMTLLVAGIVQYALLDSQSLYSSHYEAYAVRVTRDSGAVSPIEAAYRQGHTKDVISLYESQPADHFFAGQAYLVENDPQKAIAAFEAQLAVNSTSGAFKPYQDDAEYYLALAYLKTDHLSQAIPLFQRIHENPSHAYHKEVSAWYVRKLKWLQWKK